MNKTAAAALILAAIVATSGNAQDAVDLPKIDWQSVAAQVTSNIATKIAGAIAAKTNAVRALATPENYALLKSTRIVDAAKKLALQKELAEAALIDDEQTEAGRLKWHGAYTGQRIDLDTLTATFIHADGTEYSVKFQRPNIMEEVAKANAKLPKPPMLRGIPAALAKARETRYAQKTNGVATVYVEVNATKGNRPKE